MRQSIVKLDPHSIHAKAEKAFKEAVIETIRDHYLTRDPLAIWRNGKVQWVRAEKLLPLKELKKRTKRSA